MRLFFDVGLPGDRGKKVILDVGEIQDDVRDLIAARMECGNVKSLYLNSDGEIVKSHWNILAKKPTMKSLLDAIRENESKVKLALNNE